LQVQVGAALPHEPRLAWLNFLLILLACSGGRGAESAAYGCSLQEGRRRRAAAAAGWGRSGSLRCSTACESQARRPEPGSLRTPSPCVSVCVCVCSSCGADRGSSGVSLRARRGSSGVSLRARGGSSGVSLRAHRGSSGVSLRARGGSSGVSLRARRGRVSDPVTLLSLQAARGRGRVVLGLYIAV